jgi:hypothetical protein
MRFCFKITFIPILSVIYIIPRYCQAFVHIAAGLMEWLEEEEMFWVLVCIFKRLLPRDYHTTMFGSLVDQNVLADLVDAGWLFLSFYFCATMAIQHL